MCVLLQYHLFKDFKYKIYLIAARCKQTTWKIYTAYINTSAEGRKHLYFILEHPGPMYNTCCLGPRPCYIASLNEYDYRCSQFAFASPGMVQ